MECAFHQREIRQRDRQEDDLPHLLFLQRHFQGVLLKLQLHDERILKILPMEGKQ
jgi:hypothetical protein